MDPSQLQITEGSATADISKDSFFCFAVVTQDWFCYKCRMNEADLDFRTLLSVNQENVLAVTVNDCWQMVVGISAA